MFEENPRQKAHNHVGGGRELTKNRVEVRLLKESEQVNEYTERIGTIALVAKATKHGQLRQNAISCFIRRKWRKEGQRGARAQRVLPVKFDEGEEESRSSHRLQTQSAFEH